MCPIFSRNDTHETIEYFPKLRTSERPGGGGGRLRRNMIFFIHHSFFFPLLNLVVNLRDADGSFMLRVCKNSNKISHRDIINQPNRRQSSGCCGTRRSDHLGWRHRSRTSTRKRSMPEGLATLPTLRFASRRPWNSTQIYSWIYSSMKWVIEFFIPNASRLVSDFCSLSCIWEWNANYRCSTTMIKCCLTKTEINEKSNLLIWISLYALQNIQ